MVFSALPDSYQIQADRLFVLYRINSPVYRDAFYKFARKLAGNTGYINTLLIQMTNYPFINEDTELIDFLIKECGATAINEMLQYTYSSKVFIHLRDNYNIRSLENIGEIPVMKKTCSLHIWRISRGARIESYAKEEINMILREGGGILLHLSPSLLQTRGAIPFVKRHTGIQSEINKTCLNCVVSIVMEYVVYENII
jgi:hypothetical protein